MDLKIQLSHSVLLCSNYKMPGKCTKGLGEFGLAFYSFFPPLKLVVLLILHLCILKHSKVKMQEVRSHVIFLSHLPLLVKMEVTQLS